MRVLASALLLAVSLLPLPVYAAPTDSEAQIQRVLDLTNVERQKAGLSPLALSHQLNNAAQSYSALMATSGCFAHTCGPVPDMADRLGQAGYTGWSAIAENIAAGDPSPEDVVAGWMASAGHRTNILSSSYTEIGIGLATGGGPYTTFWTEDFGARFGSVVEETPPPSDEESAVEES